MFPPRHTECKKCGKAVRLIFSSAKWHEANDPIGGYCMCVSEPIIQACREADRKFLATEEGQAMVEAAVASMKKKLACSDDIESQIRAIRKHQIPKGNLD